MIEGVISMIVNYRQQRINSGKEYFVLIRR